MTQDDLLDWLADKAEAEREAAYDRDLLNGEGYDWEAHARAQAYEEVIKYLEAQQC